MKIKNIYIRDFGIFNNQELNDLAEGIVFIGGHNRAGKSSFLDVIRYLGYGLPQDGSIPPAEAEYYIQADLKNGKNHYSLSINGFAKPKISSQSSKNISVSDLYNNLDKFSYQQLFTISLDELQRISRIAGGQRDQKRLYSVLLGAGLSELVRVPEIAQSYFKKAADIGGKEGRTSVYSFKPYYKEIKSAQKEKNDALKEIDQFIEIKDNLDKKEEEKKELREEIKNLEKEELLLDILKNNYQEYEKIEKLKFSLSEKPDQELKAENFNDQDIDKAVELEEELLQVEKKISDLEIKIIQKSSRKEKDDFIESLLKSERVLEEYKNKKDVLAERAQNYLEDKEELKEKRSQLESEASQLNANWEDPLQEIEKIEADDLKQSEISRNLENYKNLKLELKNIKEKENDLIGEYELKQKKLKKYGDYNSNLVLKKTYTAAAISISLGLLTVFFDFSAGIYISSAFLLMIYIYYSSNYKNIENKEAEKRALEDEILALENKINGLKAESQEKNKKADELEKIIDNYRSSLGIKDNKALDMISDYYRTIQDKKSRLNLLKKDEKRLSDKENKINEELKQILKTVKNTAVFAAEDIFQLSFKEDENISLIEFSQELFIEFDKAVEALELVKEFKELNEQLKKIKKELKALTQKTEFNINKEAVLVLDEFIKQSKIIKDYIKLEEEYLSRRKQLKYTLNNSSDKIRNYLLENFEENTDKTAYKAAEQEEIIQSFISLYKEYPSLQAVENRYKKINSELKNKAEKMQETKETINSLEIKAEQLASSQKIEDAHQKINEARRNLRSLAERYAANKSVYYILKKLRERIISRAEAELLSPAADILARITENEYQVIETADNLEDAEFKTLLSDGRSFESVSQLSRGTMEQLFLAVRLSRIKEIEPPLPIVIDDSLVNFDRSHLYNAADVIAEMGESHQIFILSCHPHFAEFLNSLSDNVQYWKLDKGSFNKSSAGEVIDYLKDI